MAKDCIDLALQEGGDFGDNLRDIMEEYIDSDVMCKSEEELLACQYALFEKANPENVKRYYERGDSFGLSDYLPFLRGSRAVDFVTVMRSGATAFAKICSNPPRNRSGLQSYQLRLGRAETNEDLACQLLEVLPPFYVDDTIEDVVLRALKAALEVI